MQYELSDIDFDILNVLYFVEPFEKIMEEVAAPPKIVADCLKHLIAKKYVVAMRFDAGRGCRRCFVVCLRWLVG